MLTASKPAPSTHVEILHSTNLCPLPQNDSTKTWIVQAGSKSQELSEHNQTIPHVSCGRADAHGISRAEQKLLCLSLLPVVLAPGILSGAENQHGQSFLFRAPLHTWHLQNPAFDKQH